MEAGAAQLPDPIRRASARLCAMLELEDWAVPVLDVLARLDEDDDLYDLVEACRAGRTRDRLRLLAQIAGVEQSHVRTISTGPLGQLGLIRLGPSWALGCELLSHVRQLIGEADQDPDGVRFEEELFGIRATASLVAEDFAHIRDDLDLAVQILRNAARAGTRGVHILLHGAPGVGKSELARLMGSMAGVELFSVGERKGDHAEPQREDRLSTLLLSQKLTTSSRRCALLFEEMEDLLAGGRSNAGQRRVIVNSKGFLNRVLETAQTPVIWTSNSVDSFDYALLRRMSFVVEVGEPTVEVRRRIWQSAFSREARADLAGLATDLAERYPKAPPSVAASAARIAGLCPDNAHAPDRVARSLMRCLAPSAPEARPAGEFRLDLVNADRDLPALCERLSERREMSVSFLLSGPPGTGKSAYLRHLARQMGLEVVQKRASDLLSKWVGESEQQIAAAFREARESRSFLIFDEADSLLGDRATARASWEISQVNEMLTWMEVHDMPFACTTNLDERLDPAVRRRFLVKARLDYLTGPQVKAAFEHFFGQCPPPGLDRLTGLTPSDFALVARRARLDTDAAPAADQLAAWLAEEVEAKGLRKSRIGFSA